MKKIRGYERMMGVTGGGAFLFSLIFWALKSAMNIRNTDEKKDADVEAQANDYFPVQSPSERAAGHPLVGAA